MEPLAAESLTAQDTLFAAFRTRVDRWPDRVAVMGDGGKGKAITYRELRDLVEQLAGGLQQPEFAAVDAIGLLAENRPEWPLAYLAILASGKTVVPIDSLLKPLEILHVITHSALKMVLVSGKFEEPILQAVPGLAIYSMESTSERSWRTLFRRVDQLRPPRADRPAALIYTSGTTGNPRAVVLSHRNLLSNLEGIRQSLHFGPDDRFLSILPLHHSFECTCGFLTPLMSGSMIVYARSFKSKDILEDIGANEISIMCGVPLLFEKMHHAIRRGIEAAPWHRRLLFRLLYALSSLGWRLDRKWGKPLFRTLRGKAGLGSIRMFVSGGAAIPPEVSRFFNLLGFDFLQGYGLTECSPVVTVNRPEAIRFDSIGEPLRNVEIRIDRPDDSGCGEILVRGPNNTVGYQGNPEKTAELLRDGWLHTGDLGYYRDGHLHVCGRSKTLIVSAAGKNIYPEELEEKLLESPYVMEAVVFGRKRDARQGEEVCAILVPDLEQFRAEFGVEPDESEGGVVRHTLAAIVADTNLRMADYKRISSHSVQLAELEKTSSRKVKRSLYSHIGPDGRPMQREQK
jgi:long-chain acyl-CoA synthetase